MALAIRQSQMRVSFEYKSGCLNDWKYDARGIVLSNAVFSWSISAFCKGRSIELLRMIRDV